MRATLAIESIAAGGSGVARHEGLVVFVPRTAPGDRAVADYTVHGRLGRGELVMLEAEGPDRTAPGCRHYIADRCGGCQIQHLAYDAQRAAKGVIVRDTLARIARRDPGAPVDVAESPRQWRYRTKLTLALRRRGDRWIGGLHPYDDPGAVFALEDCPITEESVIAIWRSILDDPEQPLPTGADELRGAVRLVDGGAALVIEGGTRWPEPADWLRRVPALRGIWWGPGDARPRLVASRETGESLGASFVQVNPAVAEQVRALVVERALALEPATVVDAYAGAGATAAPLAARGVRVTAIERDRAASRWSARRLAPPSRAVTAAVEDALRSALPADLVILNPPRGGVHPRVTELLGTPGLAPRAILYVSCDPATLARDLRRLPDFEIRMLRSFDMFPQTAHVETVCELARAARERAPVEDAA